jgi:hypothetical protein
METLDFRACEVLAAGKTASSHFFCPRAELICRFTVLWLQWQLAAVLHKATSTMSEGSFVSFQWTNSSAVSARNNSVGMHAEVVESYVTTSRTCLPAEKSGRHGAKRVKTEDPAAREKRTLTLTPYYKLS